MNTTRRIQQIAQQAVTLGVAPADTPLFRADVEFGRQNSMKIWDAIAAIKQAPPVPRNFPDHVTPRRPAADDVNDDDDAPPETPELDDDNGDEAGTVECMCDCGPCLRGDCEHCSDSLCRDPNCEHGDSDDDDFD